MARLKVWMGFGRIRFLGTSLADSQRAQIFSHVKAPLDCRLRRFESKLISAARITINFYVFCARSLSLNNVSTRDMCRTRSCSSLMLHCASSMLHRKIHLMLLLVIFMEILVLIQWHEIATRQYSKRISPWGKACNCCLFIVGEYGNEKWSLRNKAE